MVFQVVKYTLLCETGNFISVFTRPYKSFIDTSTNLGLGRLEEMSSLGCDTLGKVVMCLS
jgi:hypothetical protein